MTPSIPGNIQILLDCLHSREDLQLEEMQPLQNWIDETPGGELVIAQAFAKNEKLAAALEAIDIRVPKTLERQVSAYVRQNIESVDEVEPKPQQSRSWLWTLGPRSRYVAGVFSAVAAIVLIGSCILYLNGLYGDLDENFIAEASVNWIDELDKEGGWSAPFRMQPPLPEEMARHPWTGVAEFTSQYGDTFAYEFRSGTGTRGVLFVFESEKHYKFEHIGKQPDVSWGGNANSGSNYIGIGKSGDQVNVLVVQGSSSEFGQFIRTDLRSQIAAVLKFVWFLC